MRAGYLRYRVTLQRPATQATVGGVVTSGIDWEDAETGVPAEFSEEPSQVTEENNLARHPQRAMVTLRYRGAAQEVSEDWRVIVQDFNETYFVVGRQRDPKRRFITLTLEKRSS